MALGVGHIRLGKNEQLVGLEKIVELVEEGMEEDALIEVFRY